jgi:hypothetical protein
MKTLLSIIFILFAVTAFASPFLISDPNPGATSYQLTGWTPSTIAAQSDGSLRMDVASASVGTTPLTVKACNVWGCSVAVPFVLQKQLPSAPSQLRLVP